jgi:nitrite reductase/ring-hydroxylating ferredoxin subunit
MRFYPTIVFDLDPKVQEVLLLTQKTIQIYFTLTQFVLLCFGPWILYTIGVALFTPYRKVCPIEQSECAPKDMAGRVRRAGQLLPPYPNGWFRVLHSQELKVGEVKEVQVLGQVLAVFRGEDGKARALDAFCTHLGASLAIKGTVCGNNLRCPFHGWEFEGDGTCAKIPYTEKIPSVANTKSWLVEECNSMIFVWHHADKEEPYWDCPYIEVLNNGAFVYHGHTEHEVSAHIQVCNFFIRY